MTATAPKHDSLVQGPRLLLRLAALPLVAGALVAWGRTDGTVDTAADKASSAAVAGLMALAVTARGFSVEPSMTADAAAYSLL